MTYWNEFVVEKIPLGFRSLDGASVSTWPFMSFKAVCEQTHQAAG
jgi:hypothetical protein